MDESLQKALEENQKLIQQVNSTQLSQFLQRLLQRMSVNVQQDQVIFNQAAMLALNMYQFRDMFPPEPETDYTMPEGAFLAVFDLISSNLHSPEMYQELLQNPEDDPEERQEVAILEELQSAQEKGAHPEQLLQIMLEILSVLVYW